MIITVPNIPITVYQRREEECDCEVDFHNNQKQLTNTPIEFVSLTSDELDKIRFSTRLIVKQIITFEKLIFSSPLKLNYLYIHCRGCYECSNETFDYYSLFMVWEDYKKSPLGLLLFNLYPEFFVI